VLNEFICSKLE